MELALLLERGIWFGFAAVGFAILFNVPSRTLFYIFLTGAMGGLVKTYMMYFSIDIVLATLAGATLIGMVSIPLAHNKHAPPLVFAIPSVIPLIPGVLAYRMMLGFITLAGNINNGSYTQILSETVNNGLKVMFILMCLAGGVGIPMLITRKESAKEIRLPRRSRFTRL